MGEGDLPPRPIADADSAPFWAGLASGRLMLQFGPGSGAWQFPPLECDRRTGGPLVWREVRAVGSVFSFIVQRQRVAPGFDDHLPYVIALIELDDAPGVRLPVRMEDAVGRVRVGSRVVGEFQTPPDAGFPLVVFRLVDIR